MFSLKHTKCGLTVFNSNDIFVGRSLQEYGEYCEKEVELFQALIKPNFHVLDIGANIGAHTLPLAKLAERVYAYEPQRLAYYALCANVVLNQIQNVICLQNAVGDEDSRITVPELDPCKSNNFGGLELTENYSRGISVKLIKLDNVKFERVDFIKLDIEGMETQAVLGAQNTIKQSKPLLYIEMDRKEKAMALVKLLRQYGYEIYFHASPLFNPNNFYRNQTNIFGNIACTNVLCIHPENPTDADLSRFYLTQLSSDKTLIVLTPGKEENEKIVRDLQTECANRLLNIADACAEGIYDVGEAIKHVELAENLSKKWEVYNKGCAVLARHLKFKESLEYIDKSIPLVENQQQLTVSLLNKAIALGNLRRYDESVLHYKQIISYEPNHIEAHFGLACDLLITGQYKEGWQEYEWRFKRDMPVLIQFMKGLPEIPDWDGSDLHGKRILLYIEQGVGDHIQFLRYVPMVKEKGGYVGMCCFESTEKLFATTVGVDELIRYTDDIYLPDKVDFDLKVSLMSLPHIFGTTLENIPSQRRYLNPQKGKKYLNSLRGMKVGICWAGSETHKNDNIRSCYLKYFKNIAESTKLISLQKGRQKRHWPDKGFVNLMEGAENLELTDFTEELKDFNDTANLIDELDLVITVDTSIAHIAGALGKPVWLLHQLQGDWRWLTHREDSPWYPSMRIFRGDSWEEIFLKVNKAYEETRSYTANRQ